MSTRTAIGYAAAGVIVAASTVTATLATFGLGGGAEATGTPHAVATAGAEQALVTTPGGSTITLAPGEQLASSEIVQTPAGPVEYLYVNAAPSRRGHDDDDDEHKDRERTSSREHDDDDDEHEDDHHNDRRESRSSIRGERR